MLKISDAQRLAANAGRKDAFRQKVISHALQKVQFATPARDDDVNSVADLLYDYVDWYLKDHERATYDSYVMMMVVYFIRGIDAVHGPDMQATLQNPRIGINTRVRVAYEISKVFLRSGK
ncbi:MAG: hypothetical protein AAGF78_14015 [Pseudomonadota bacterium]